MTVNVTEAPRHRGGAALSDEVRVATAPTAGYERLLTQPAPESAWRPLARPAMVLLVIGTSVPIMAVGRVTFGLAASTAAGWSFLVAVQMLLGTAVITSAPARRASLPRALELWFAGHLPYSLWLLLVAAWTRTTGKASLDLFLLSAVVPAIWTMVILSAFCRSVLRTTVAGARWRVACHQLATWTLVFAYVVWSAGGLMAVASFLARRMGVQ